MLVDDDDPTNFLQEKILRLSGCTENIRVFEDALQALDYLSKSLDPERNGPYYQKPDLILLDINMPRVNGWDFIEEYLKHSENKKDGVIIMMLTTSLNPDDREKAGAIHEISGFYTKPLTLEMLEAILEKHFPDNL